MRIEMHAHLRGALKGLLVSKLQLVADSLSDPVWAFGVNM